MQPVEELETFGESGLSFGEFRFSRAIVSVSLEAWGHPEKSPESGRDGVEGTGLTPFFELPEYIRERVYSGEELGKVMEEISGIKDIKLKEGAVGWLSRGLMTRKELYCCGLRVALINLIQAGIPAKLR